MVCRGLLIGVLAIACLAVSGKQARAEASAPNLSTGYFHSCARTSVGLWCWGANDSGQLGYGNAFGVAGPLLVQNLGTSVVEVSNGGAFTCARKGDGTLWCWGNNTSGQLGNGTTTGSTTPVQVAGLGSAVAEVSAGNDVACARKVDGSLWCFGNNGSGALGIGNTIVTFSATPVQVFFSSGPVVSAGVSTGADFALAVLSDGTLSSWGADVDGQLGLGTFGAPAYSPTPLPTFGSTALQVSAGSGHSCVRTTGNALWCFGQNSNGQLGNGTTTDSATPVQASISDVMQVDTGQVHTCALKTDGTLWCWGANNSGQLGDGTTTDRSLPVQVGALGNSVAEVATGAAHTCARKVDSTFWCWGDNSRGQLGYSTTSISASTPSQVRGLLVTCGDGLCSAPETKQNCPIDCTPPPPPVVPVPPAAAGLLAALLLGVGLHRRAQRV